MNSLLTTFRLIALLAAVLLMGCFGVEQETTLVPANGGNNTVDPTDVVNDDPPASDTPQDPPTTDSGHTVDPTTVPDDSRAELRDLDADALVGKLGDAELASVASDELAARGATAVDALTAALDAEDRQVQSQAIFTLGRLGEAANPALPELKQLAETADSDVVRDAAAFAIDAIEGN